MTQREKNLAIAVVGLLVGYGGWLGWGWWQDAVESRRTETDAATVAVAEAQLRETTARASLRRLETFRERSLPRDPEIAQSQYRAWLVNQLTDAGLSFESVKRVSAPIRRADAYTSMPFKAQAEGDLKSVVGFLHAFYSSRVTHKLTQMKLTPVAPGGRLRVDFDIEAIVVDGTGRKAGLPSAPSNRLRLAEASAYLGSLASRNPFAEYKPPSPPAPPKTEPKVVKNEAPPADESEHARFTGAVGSGASMQAWVTVQTTGEVLRLSAGDVLSVGLLEGRVVEVGARELIYEADEQQVRVPLGKKLREGEPLADAELL